MSYVFYYNMSVILEMFFLEKIFGGFLTSRRIDENKASNPKWNFVHFQRLKYILIII